ncbi:neuropeptide CCHamide-1 receptor-like [Rhodnius prolixus]|uniref:neuropeptide CCHamide-1 receptor-like n=1 Tax=Rhodnius prolixus TaxID=13249 RepID=UPI003D18DFDA
MRKLYSSIGGRGATRCTIMIACAIWLLAIACAIPGALFSYIRIFKQGNHTLFEICYPYPEELGSVYPRGLVMAKFLIYYAIPLTVIGCFYILMARHLVLSTKNMPGELQGQARQVRARKKVAKTVLAFVLVFAVCFLPQHVFLLWFYNNPNSDRDYNEFWHVFKIVGYCLSFINSCINPIALYCVSGTFRKHFDRYLVWWKRRDLSDSRYACRRQWDSTTLAPLHHSTTTRRVDGAHECTVLTTFINGTTATNQQQYQSQPQI